MQIPENISFGQAASIPLGLATVTTDMWNHHLDRTSVGFVAPYEEGGETNYAGNPAFILEGSSSIGQYGASSSPASSSLHILAPADTNRAHSHPGSEALLVLAYH